VHNLISSCGVTTCLDMAGNLAAVQQLNKGQGFNRENFFIADFMLEAILLFSDC